MRSPSDYRTLVLAAAFCAAAAAVCWAAQPSPDELVEQLGARDQPEAFDALLRLARHADWAVRAAAVDALASAAPPPGRQAQLAECLRGALRDEDAFVASRAVEALGGSAGLRPADYAPDLEAAVRRHPELADVLAPLARTLPWPERRELFDAACGGDLAPQGWAALFRATYADAPRGAEDDLWRAFDGDPRVLAAPEGALEAVLDFYGARDGLRDPHGAPSPPAAAVLARRAAERVSGSEEGRAALSLILLWRADAEQGRAESLRLLREARGELRAAAAGLLLAAGWGGPEGAAEMLGDADVRVRRAAVAALTRTFTPMRPEFAVRRIGDAAVCVAFLAERPGRLDGFAPGLVGPWEPPRLPEGLSPEHLRPLLADEDEETARGAAYLLALLGDGSGLDLLAEAWRARPSAVRRAERRLALAGAIAALGDVANAPLLAEVVAAGGRGEGQDVARELGRLQAAFEARASAR